MEADLIWMVVSNTGSLFPAATLRGVALTRASLAARQAAQLRGVYGQNAAALAAAGMRQATIPQGLAYTALP